MSTRVLTPALTAALFLFPSSSFCADAAVADAKVETDAKATASQPAAKVPIKVKPEEPKDVPEAVEEVKDIWAAFKGGKYREAIAGILVVLIFMWRRFGAKFIIGKLSTWGVGLVTVILGFVGTIPEALTVDPWNWKTFIWSGLLTSAEAMLLWQMIGKKVLPKIWPTDDPKEDLKPEADEPTEPKPNGD